MKMCFGRPAAWYGGLVGGLNSTGLIGFDDGDLKAFSTAQLRAEFDAATLTAYSSAGWWPQRQRVRPCCSCTLGDHQRSRQDQDNRFAFGQHWPSGL